MTVRLELQFATREDFERCVVDSLRRGRAFVPDASGPADRTPCHLAVWCPGHSDALELRGEIVFAQEDGPGAGVGVDITEPELDQRLDDYLDSCKKPHSPQPSESPGSPPQPLELELTAPAQSDAPSIRTSAHPSEPPRSSARSGSMAPSSGNNIHQRVRKMNASQRNKLARQGTLTERVALERAFGSAVLEQLLQNPQLTTAEVARIAKNGTVPTPILGTIVNQSAFVARPEVRRALLSNPRLGAAHIDRVLKALPPNELKQVGRQTAYPQRVRLAARRMLKR